MGVVMCSYDVITGDCREVMASMDANSVDAIVTDPPYFKVKGEAWDHQWDKSDEFIEWLDGVASEWFRVLKPNGSLYCFASPKMSARVEVMLGERFNIHNRIRWTKSAGWHNKTRPEDLRSWLSPWEEIIFADHYGSDNIAKGEAGYVAKCDKLRGFLFEPLRAYLAGEWERAGLTSKQANDATETQMSGHYFTCSQWALPTEQNYNKLREYANRNGGDYLKREYDELKREYDELKREYDELKQEYDELKQEYESLRRPFSVTAEVPYTDVWSFPTVQHYAGKHPCEKPQPLLEHIIKASTRPGAVVLDSFAGTGSTGIACKSLGRSFIGIEKCPKYADIARQRIAHEAGFAPLYVEAG
jgi:adenine-specific DNA-methyltransferase